MEREAGFVQVGASYCQQEVFRMVKGSKRGVGGAQRGVQEVSKR